VQIDRSGGCHSIDAFQLVLRYAGSVGAAALPSVCDFFYDDAATLQDSRWHALLVEQLAALGVAGSLTVLRTTGDGGAAPAASQLQSVDLRSGASIFLQFAALQQTVCTPDGAPKNVTAAQWNF
jgi:hypothetical protein